MQVAEPHADRDAITMATPSDASDSQTCSTVFSPDQAGVVEQELNRVLEGRSRHALRARSHGASSRWSNTSSASATSASATARRPAATNSVLKPLWIALKIGWPSPPAR